MNRALSALLRFRNPSAIFAAMETAARPGAPGDQSVGLLLGKFAGQLVHRENKLDEKAGAVLVFLFTSHIVCHPERSAGPAHAIPEARKALGAAPGL